jgi:hypothetical protein
MTTQHHWSTVARLIFAVVAIAGFVASSWAEAQAALLFAGSSSTYWNDFPREVAKVVDRKYVGHLGAIVIPEIQLAVKNKIRLYAPCSSAWEHVYRERLDLALQHPKDSAHPGDAGHFLNLACFYASLTGESPVGKLPHTYPVWPHALANPANDVEKAGEDTRIAAFKPDAYQAKMPKWMFKNMSMNLTATLDDETAKYLEGVAWETWTEINGKLKAAIQP